MATYLHFVGGRYTPQTFITEAQQYGITRRANAASIKNMNFGDTILLCDWRRGAPAVFGEFVLTDLVFDADINSELLPLLQEQGVVESVDSAPGGGIVVRRKCGTFTMTGSVTIRTASGESGSADSSENEDESEQAEQPRITLREMIELAQTIQAQQQDGLGIDEDLRGALWCMIGGRLTATYFPPRTLAPSPKFTRGFMRQPDGMTFAVENADQHETPHAPRMIGVANYERTWNSQDGEE